MLSLALAQQQDEAAPKFKLNVNQIQVPVIVTDAKGHRISGLKAEDFEVLEDGTPQQILSFNMGGEAPVAAPGADGAARSRLIPKKVRLKKKPPGAWLGERSIRTAPFYRNAWRVPGRLPTVRPV